MALRDPEIPNHRERSSLQFMKYDRWIVGNDLYPAGNETIASPVKKLDQTTGRSLGSPTNPSWYYKANSMIDDVELKS
jgi:hypothetical protein